MRPISINRLLLTASVLAAGITLTTPLAGQEIGRCNGTIIEMHMHALAVTLGPDGKQVPIYCYPAPDECVRTAATSEEDVLRMTLKAMVEFNIVKGFLSGSLDRVAKWKSAAPDRFIGSPLI